MNHKFAFAAGAAFLLAGFPQAQAAPGFDVGALLAPASYLGVGVIDVTDEAARELGLVEPHGIEIASVAHDSPAARSGLRAGDIVLSYRGETVQGYLHFARLVRETPAGRSVEVDLVRDGKRQKLTVQPGERHPQGALRGAIESIEQRLGAVRDRIESDRQRQNRERFNFDNLELGISVPTVGMHMRNTRLGTVLEGLDGQLADYFGVEEGVLVRAVGDGSVAEMAGLRAGDVIVSVDGNDVAKPAQVGRIAAAADGPLVDVVVLRDRQEISLKLDPGQPEARRARPVSLTR